MLLKVRSVRTSFSVTLNMKLRGKKRNDAPVRAANQCFGFDLDLKQHMLMKAETVGIGFLVLSHVRMFSYMFLLNRP